MRKPNQIHTFGTPHYMAHLLIFEKIEGF